MEGFAVLQADEYDVMYTAYIKKRDHTSVSTDCERCGTCGQAMKKEETKVWIASSVNSHVTHEFELLVHMQGTGDRTFRHMEFAGTRAQSRRIEGFQIRIEPPAPCLSLQYMAHVEGVGDTSWIEEGEFAASRGESKRIEGCAFRLTGWQADCYDVFYTAHIQKVGDTNVSSNGEYCGTRGKGMRVEGMTVWLGWRE
jgi:Clostridial hydrophobic W